MKKLLTVKTGILALIVVVAGYFVIHALTAKTVAPTYVIGPADKGTIVSAITGTGQISTSQTVNLQPQVSGPLVAVYAKPGQTVHKGQALFSIQATDAARAVQTAKDNLASAQLDLRSTQSQSTNSTSDLAKAVKNAYTTLLSSNLEPQPVDVNTSSYQAPTISGNYALGTEGTITLTTYSSQGGKGSFDAIGYHPYTFPQFPSASISNAWAKMSIGANNLRSIMIANGDTAKKVWITEFGAPSNGPDAHWYVSEADQAKMLTDTLNLYKTYDWAGPLLWYTYKDGGTTTDTNENFFGVVHSDYSQKPIYQVMKDALVGGLQ